VQGFCFAQMQYSHTQAFTAALQRLFRRFALFHRTQYRSHTSRPYTACTAPEGIPSSAAPPQIPDTTATPNAVQGREAAYYNKVYKGAAVRSVMDPCQTARLLRGAAPPPIQGQPGGCLDAFHARRFAVWHWVNGQSAPAGALHPAGQSSGRGTAGGAEPLTATAVSLFGLSPDSQ